MDKKDIESPGISPVLDPTRLKTLRDYRVLDTEPENRFDELTLLASRICDTPISIISLVDEDRLYFKSTVGLDVREIPSAHSFCVEVVCRKEPLIVKDAKEDERFACNPLVHSEPYFRFYAASPLLAPNNCVIGTLCVIDYIPRNLNLEQKEALNILSRQVITQMELDNLAIRDPLTGLFNRRYAEEQLQAELRKMERKQSTLGLIILDIDHFKKINDTYGHHAGDALLKSFGKMLVENIRFEDIVCRMGGEEFMIIMPDSNSDIVMQRAEKVREQVMNMDFTHDGQLLDRITISAGIACYPVNSESLDGLYQEADNALYIAKNSGRNKVVFAESNMSNRTH